MDRKVRFEDMIAINFKIFEQTNGPNAVLMALMCDTVAEETGANIMVATQNTDLYRVVQALKTRRPNHIPVFAQHVDPIGPGKGTGKVSVWALVASGADGALINHSEDKLTRAGSIADDVELEIKPRVEECKQAGLAVMVCSGFDDNKDFIAEAKAITKVLATHPASSIAPEPPALIGGDVSVTTKADDVRELVAAVKGVEPEARILLGAGVKKGEHMKGSLEYGAHGALLASGVAAPLKGKGDLQGEGKVGVTRPLTREGLRASTEALLDLVSGVNENFTDGGVRREVADKVMEGLTSRLEVAEHPKRLLKA